MAFSGYVRTALTSRPSSDSGTVGGCSTTAAAAVAAGAAFKHRPEVEHTDVLMTLRKRAALTLIFIFTLNCPFNIYKVKYGVLLK